MAMSKEERLARKREAARARRAANPEAEREAKRRWRAKNTDALAAAHKAWRAANPEKVRTYSQEWREANPEKARETNRKTSARWRKERPASVILNNCRKSARVRGHECTITAADIEALLEPMTCSVTGLPLSWKYDGIGRANPWAPSIDRIDCSRGYEPGNVRAVCWAFNQMRGDFPDEVVATLAEAFVRRRVAP
ncbi:hypothetical protein [Pseudomonas aeruginosa]|uniref:hypothetical protein n=1 Tax=Pseudomonas aeruginosa TaxID=287 RepID=UPI002738B159|nr:hypothetical protein [Pseudomonas aeruginosa]